MAENNNECLCDYCGNPCRNIQTDKCTDMSCYWYSGWMPMPGMSEAKERRIRAEIADMNW